MPVVDLCFREGSHGPEGLDFFRVDYSKGKGELVALDARSGRRLWTRKFPSPNFGCATVANDVVFTATYDGTIYGLSVADGRTLWKATARAGINACPAVAGRTLLIVAGTDHPAFESPVLELERSACRDTVARGGGSAQASSASLTSRPRARCARGAPPCRAHLLDARARRRPRG